MLLPSTRGLVDEVQVAWRVMWAAKYNWWGKGFGISALGKTPDTTLSNLFK